MRDAMLTVNIHEAKTHLSRLVEAAAKGDAFMIAKVGKPLVRVEALTSAVAPRKRSLGFPAGQFTVPGDFDRLGEA